MAPAANIAMKQYTPEPEYNETNNATHCDKQKLQFSGFRSRFTFRSIDSTFSTW